MNAVPHLCRTHGCVNQANFSLSGLPPISCAVHKHPGMIDIRNIVTSSAAIQVVQFERPSNGPGNERQSAPPTSTPAWSASV